MQDTILLDTTVGDVGVSNGVWGFYESGVASDPSNGALCLF